MGWKHAKERKHEQWIRIMAVAIIALGSVGKPLVDICDALAVVSDREFPVLRPWSCIKTPCVDD